MKRRQFIQATTSSLLLPVVLSSLDGPALAAAAIPPQRPDRFFFDDRFAAARRHAASAAHSARFDCVAVQGDVTPFWIGGIEALARRSPVHLRGATTESFRFCLQILLRERADVRMQVTRIDSNLLLWTMHGTPLHPGESLHG